MGNPFKALVPIGLFALGLFGLSKMGGAKPGEVVLSGEQVVTTDELKYERRVIHSEEAAELPFAAQVRKAGFGGWTLESVVAWGPTAADAKANMLTWFLDKT